MFFILVLSLIGFLIVLFLSGPKLNMSYKIKSIDLPMDLDNYVIANEKKIEKLIPGTEKKIIWANNIVNEKTEYSLVYFHGFTTSRQEISPVTETIANKLGANIFFTRLAGHGINDIDALGKVTLNDWLNDAWEAYEIGKRIGKKIIFISVSAGSILSLWLSLQYSNDVAANIIISPMFEPAQSSARLMLLPWGNLIVRIVIGKYQNVASPTNVDKFKRFISLIYPSKALITMMSLCKFSWGLKLKNTKVPTLCFYTENDHVISIYRLKSELSKLDDKFIKILKVNAKHHCLVGDAVCPETNDEVIKDIMDFLSKYIFSE